MPPHHSVPHPSSHELKNAIHPYDKLVIGLPTAMEGWRRAYGSVREWCKLPSNPLLVSPVNGGGEESRSDRNHPLTPSSRSTSGHPDSAAARPFPSSVPHTNGPCFHKLSTVPASRKDAALYCDACQREFATEEKYAAHMDTHVYCTVAGCRFTCRKSKPWRMEEHMELLHNRPDAPNLVDTSAYLEQRKRRFPTQDAVKVKVEELYYKAARGVVLPDERRRWMQQHGIVIRKRPRTDASMIIRGELPTESRSPSTASSASASSSCSSRRSSRSSSEHRQRCFPRRSPRELPQSPASTAAGRRTRFIQPPSAPPYQESDPTAAPTQASTESPQVSTTGDQCIDAVSPAATALPSAKPSSSSSAGAHAAPAHPSKIIPLGPNGTLTPRQRVQLVRERYAAAKDVPQFYVCHRCGIKGEHWVGDCPTKGDSTYDRHVLWGEAKFSAVEKGAKPRREKVEKDNDEPEQPRQRSAPQQEEPEATAPSDSGIEQTVAEQVRADAPIQLAPDEPCKVSSVAPDAEAHTSSTPPPGDCAAAAVDIPNVQSDEDAPPVPHSAALPTGTPKEVTRMMAPVAAAKHAQTHRREPARRPPPPPTLYERLTEEARMDEQGILLQALRFFVARDFFQYRP
ncbi:Zinc knuckle, putative [Leishmania lindenbergi]|uniref:Zinc knuckle n=1 Tax=Leishmania lindenbergi TaxID=651832 RepID=A0AAW3A6M6_9TRYP